MKQEEAYEDAAVKGFIFSSLFWLVIGLVVGLLIAAQLFAPALNLLPWLTYGRLRPVHTNGVSFGFAVTAIIGVSYYVVQRLARAPLPFPGLARASLWLMNITVALGAASLFMGFTSSKEYAELEWPIDILVVIVWVMFAVNVVATLIKRREEQMYISLWYILATVVVVALLYIVNNLAVPVSFFKSYSIYAGANDANVQWWYGHNAVASLFTFPILAFFYYFLPKSTNMPIYSHRLSIISFWSLVFGYMWTGAHHLVYTPIPDWIQTMAIGLSIFLIAPSWGSVINGYYTMQGSWATVQSNYLVKFFLWGITFYGLQTIQGPTQAVRWVSQFVHYTDYIPGHVHMGTMGWVTMIISASFYYLVPRLYNTTLHSIKLANTHFWLVLVGQLIFSITMWITGIQQGAMLTATNADGSLRYSFLETLAHNYPYWMMRFAGGLLFFAGIVIFVYNLARTTANRGGREAAA